MREKYGLKKLLNEVPIEQYRTLSKPMLVSRSKAVSGKLYIASEIGQMDKIGQDCVTVCMNDIAAIGADPLFFYDNISSARPRDEKLQIIEAGITEACKESGIQYAGSEISLLPDNYSLDQYDFVGFIVGIMNLKKKSETTPLTDGDVIIGLPSNGLHNDGYITARKQMFLSRGSMEVYYDTLGSTLGEALVQPVRSYRKSLEMVREKEIELKSCVQVSEGGLDRALRILLQEKYGAVIKRKEETIPPLYRMIHRDGNMELEQMRQIFNMGLGMLMAVSEQDADRTVECLEEQGEEPILLGLVETERELIRYL